MDFASITINIFHDDPRPSLQRWRAPADRFHVKRQVRSDYVTTQKFCMYVLD